MFGNKEEARPVPQQETLLTALDAFADGQTVAALTMEENLLTGTDAAGEILLALVDEPQICRFAMSEPGKPLLFHEVR